ncbi:DNA repair helicase [Phage NCTB]|nr:DNA repair helicase [Phage NCTB]
MSDKLYLRAKMYIPFEYIDEDDLKKHYDHHRYDDTICKSCDFRKIRFTEECASCELGGYQGCIRTWSTYVYRGVTYAALPIGDRLNVEEKLGIEFSQFKVVDLRTKSKFDYKVKFTGQLRPKQIPLVEDWAYHKHGIIKAPPRTGKTVTSIAIGIKMGHRFVIIANQRDYLNNFLKEIKLHTNLPKLEEKTGKRLYGWLEKKEDFEQYQIGIMTYQSLISDKNGKKKRKWLNQNFGTLWIDEIQKANANEFSQLVGSVRTKYKGGCTATIKRKDGKHFLMTELVGPKVAEAKIDTLIPTIHVHETPDVKPKNKRQFQNKGPSAWTGAMRFLGTHEKRNKFIVDQILKDLKAGRSIVFPVYTVYHSKDIVDTVNKAWGSTIAAQFVGGSGKAKQIREKILEDANAGTIRLVCGTRSLLQVGLNVPRWDTHYYGMPMSNAPNWEQESSRILTPASEDVPKQSPIIRMFVDPELGQSIGCFKSTWRHSQGLKYQFSGDAMQWYKENVGMSANEAGKYSIDYDGYSESEIRELEAMARQKKQKKEKKSAPSGGLFSRRM